MYRSIVGLSIMILIGMSAMTTSAQSQYHIIPLYPFAGVGVWPPLYQAYQRANAADLEALMKRVRQRIITAQGEIRNISGKASETDMEKLKENLRKLQHIRNTDIPGLQGRYNAGMEIPYRNIRNIDLQTQSIMRRITDMIGKIETGPPMP